MTAHLLNSTAATFAPATDQAPERLLTSAKVREMLGGMSDMSLWRWLNDPAMAFPQPIYIARRRFWKEAELAAWLEAQPRANTAA